MDHGLTPGLMLRKVINAFDIEKKLKSRSDIHIITALPLSDVLILSGDNKASAVL